MRPGARSANDDLLDMLKEALDRVGAVTGRRMFGGMGAYCDGIFFAIIDDGIIYVRTSDATRPKFEAERSGPFTYTTKNGPAELHSYWRLPERLLDEVDELCDWAKDAVAAAREVQSQKQQKASSKAGKQRVVGVPDKGPAKPKPSSKTSKRS